MVAHVDLASGRRPGLTPRTPQWGLDQRMSMEWVSTLAHATRPVARLNMAQSSVHEHHGG
jgi:hypothetical protein